MFSIVSDDLGAKHDERIRASPKSWHKNGQMVLNTRCIVEQRVNETNDCLQLQSKKATSEQTDEELLHMTVGQLYKKNNESGQ